MIPFSAAFSRAVHFGHLAAVHLPDSKEPVPEDVLSRLDDLEREHALGLNGYRQVDWVGGRLALREALVAMDRRAPPLLVDEWGAPTLPQGLSASVSHKRTLAVALLARSRFGRLGVDLEDLGPERMGIAERVLLPEEHEAVMALPEHRRWTGLVLRFSMKEAIYKALHPYVHRYVGFDEALVRPDIDCTAQVELRLKQGEGPFRIEARYLWLGGRILTMVRARPPRRPRRGKKPRQGQQHAEPQERRAVAEQPRPAGDEPVGVPLPAGHGVLGD